jgi:hypothetical protein
VHPDVRPASGCRRPRGRAENAQAIVRRAPGAGPGRHRGNSRSKSALRCQRTHLIRQLRMIRPRGPIPPNRDAACCTTTDSSPAGLPAAIQSLMRCSDPSAEGSSSNSPSAGSEPPRVQHLARRCRHHGTGGSSRSWSTRPGSQPSGSALVGHPNVAASRSVSTRESSGILQDALVGMCSHPGPDQRGPWVGELARIGSTAPVGWPQPRSIVSGPARAAAGVTEKEPGS